VILDQTSSKEPKTIKTFQPVSAVYMKHPDFFFTGDIFGGINVYEKQGTVFFKFVILSFFLNKILLLLYCYKNRSWSFGYMQHEKY
jgi:hypothetical protein